MCIFFFNFHSLLGSQSWPRTSHTNRLSFHTACTHASTAQHEMIPRLISTPQSPIIDVQWYTLSDFVMESFVCVIALNSSTSARPRGVHKGATHREVYQDSVHNDCMLWQDSNYPRHCWTGGQAAPQETLLKTNQPTSFTRQRNKHIQLS